jgi:FkbM family methyltransferase
MCYLAPEIQTPGQKSLTTMNNPVKTILLKGFFRTLAKIRNQQIWENIYQLALRQMNFGNGGDFNESGELYVAKYIGTKLEKEPVIIIFDVGANIGAYSKALSDLFKDKARIFSFEPSRKTFDILLNTIKNCRNITPNNLGFSDKGYNHVLYSDSEGSGLASLYQRNLEHFGIKMDKTEEIKLTTIDAFCKDNNIERIHFLKLDIEGHELHALKGAMKMINDKKIDFLQFEFGGCNIDSKTFFRDYYYLLKEHYTLYRILKDDIYELPTYKETYEIFVTINYLAIRK